MSLITYLPATLSAEKNRFRAAQGNVKIDYRKSDGSAPILLGTPYLLAEGDLGEFSLDILPAKVPADPHITGDIENYRRFSTELAIVSEEFQRNVIILAIAGVALSSEYVKSTFERGLSGGSDDTSHSIQHEFTVNNALPVLPLLDPDNVDDYLNFIEPLVLVEETGVAGLVGTSNTILLKKGELENVIGYSTYVETTTYNETTGEYTTVGTIIFTEYVDTDHGETGTDVTALANPAIKALTTFEARKENDDSFTPNLLYVTNFKKQGETFSTSLLPVLDDTNSNYYLYSKSINAPQDIIGISTNISEENGTLLSLVLSADLEEYTDFSALVGSVNFLSTTAYTGLFASPFLLIKVTFPIASDTFSIKINLEDEVVLGSYGESTFKHLCAKLADLLYDYGILVIPCKNNMIALSKFKDDVDIEVELSSTLTKLNTQNSFTDFQYLNSDKTITFDPTQHPLNTSFTYVETDTGLIKYKFKVNKDTSRPDIYLSDRVRLLINYLSIRGTTQNFKIETQDGTFETSITIPSDMIVTDIVDLVATSIDELLDSKYTIDRNYLSVGFDLVNTLPTEGMYLKITAGEWMMVSDIFGGIYYENEDLSKSFPLDKNDGTTIVITGSGPIALNIQDTTNIVSLGTSDINPMTYDLSQDTLGVSTFQNAYSQNLVHINQRLRPYGYEAYPLFDTESSTTLSQYIGISRIIASNSTKLYLAGGASREDLYNAQTYKSAKGLYVQRDNIKTILTEDNASIVEWLQKPIPLQSSARPFEIKDSSISLYGKKSIQGILAQRDGLVLSRREYVNDAHLELTLNPVSNSLETCKKLHMFLSGTLSESSTDPVLSGSEYSLTHNNVTLVYNITSGAFTVTYEQSLLDFGLDIGYTQDNDITFDYDGWFNYPYGYNTSSVSSTLFETAPKAKILIVSFNTTIDGV